MDSEDTIGDLRELLIRSRASNLELRRLLRKGVDENAALKKQIKRFNKIILKINVALGSQQERPHEMPEVQGGVPAVCVCQGSCYR